jgi:hypothetical protein
MRSSVPIGGRKQPRPRVDLVTGRTIVDAPGPADPSFRRLEIMIVVAALLAVVAVIRWGAFAAGPRAARYEPAVPAISYVETGQAPAPGQWSALGFVDNRGPDPLRETWTITRSCGADGCLTMLDRQIGATTVRSALVHKPDGWHASWPADVYGCGYPGSTTWVIRFMNAGYRADARQRATPGCPLVSWEASLSARA